MYKGFESLTALVLLSNMFAVPRASSAAVLLPVGDFLIAFLLASCQITYESRREQFYVSTITTTTYCCTSFNLEHLPLG